VTTPEPERELVRRALPFAPPALLLAFALGAAIAGWGAGWSAALGIAIVAANAVASAVSVSWAASISLTALFGVGLGGFVVRMAAILGMMLLLSRFGWFSPVAFGAAVIPATIVLLVFEMKQLSGRLQADLWGFRSREGGVQS
jgi:hypothetical protein